MKKTLIAAVIALFFSSIWIVSCKKDTIDPSTWEPVSFSVPYGWPQPVYTFTNNPLTSDGFTLGRKLFYDVRLSRDNTISCGSCHQQFAAFAHLDHDVSHGIYGLLGTRNSPGMFNLAWHPSFFWDGGVNHLESQPINPLQSHVEMDMTLPEVVARVAADNDYRARFKKAFGDETVNTQRIFRAMSLFMAAMVSDNSRYDKHEKNLPGGTFSDAEERGLKLFRQHCATCHKEPLFSDFSFRNNGLVPKSSVNDSGRAHITRSVDDLYKFKVPSLRNVALTRPYMHDGRFMSLESSVEHYRTGIIHSATTDPKLSSNVNISDQEKSDIVSFLHTLTDSTFITNKLFAEPVN
jgi:cytochrome c peroxidase